MAFLQEVLGGRSIEEEEPSEAKYFRKQARNITRLYEKLKTECVRVGWLVNRWLPRHV